HLRLPLAGAARRARAQRDARLVVGRPRRRARDRRRRRARRRRRLARRGVRVLLMAHVHPHRPLAGHLPAVAPDADRRRLVAALALLGGFMLVEVVVGVVVRSLALLADAGHMLADTGALALALLALSLAGRPARGPLPFGFRRAEILSAQANGLTLAVLAVLVVVEGVRRLVHPPEP